MINFQGDGESLPETPPNENRDGDSTPPTPTEKSLPVKSASEETSAKSIQDVSSSIDATSSSIDATSSPLVVQIRVDLLAMGLMLAGIASRMVFLDQPRNVV